MTNARSSGDGGRTLTTAMGVAFMFQSALGLGPSKDNVRNRPPHGGGEQSSSCSQALSFE